MTIHYYVPALLFMIVLGICSCKATNPMQNEEEKEDRAIMFSKQVKDLLTKIILNGWDLGDVVIPKLDPLEIQQGSIGPLDTPGIMLIKNAYLENATITGLSEFISNTIGISLNGSTVAIVFDLIFNVEGSADFVDLDVVIGETIPFYGNGTLSLNASFKAKGAINANSDPYILVTDIDLALDFTSLNIHISNLMGLGETRQSQIFNDLIGEVTPPTVNLLAPIMIPSIVNPLVGTINTELEKIQITFGEISMCFINPSSCKFPMP